MVIVAFLALAVAALSVGGVVAKAMLTIVGAFFVAISIVAVVARDYRHVFAIGFVIPFSLYVALLYASDANELDPYEPNAMITTRAVQPIHATVVRQTWIEHLTGKALPQFKLDQYTIPEPGADKIYVSQSGTAATMTERPERATFMLAAHCLIASVLGYLGGKFAMFVRKSDLTFAPSSIKKNDEPADARESPS